MDERQAYMQERTAYMSRKIAALRKAAEDNFQVVDEETIENTIDEDLEDEGYGDADDVYEEEFEDYGFEELYTDPSEEEFDAYEVEMPESDSTMQSLTSASIKLNKLANTISELSKSVEILKKRKEASLKRKQALNNNYNKNKYDVEKSNSFRPRSRDTHGSDRRRVR